MPGSGRRAGSPPTRETILTAARRIFAEHGYEKASVRAIATAAQVDPALVHYWFGSKDGLFLAVVDAPIDPARLVPQIVEGGAGELPERLLRAFLSIWDDPVTGGSAIAMLRGSYQHADAARLLRDFFEIQLLRRVTAQLRLEVEGLPFRFSLIASQMIGLATMRYVLRLEPLASAPAEVLVQAVAPALQVYLTGPVPGGAGESRPPACGQADVPTGRDGVA